MSQIIKPKPITQRVKEAISSHPELPEFKKLPIFDFIDKVKKEKEKEKEDLELIKKITWKEKIAELILSTDEVKIYKVKPELGDNSSIEYPFRSIYKDKNENWQEIGTVAANMDEAYLVYLERKHLGANSQFVTFAMKMLEINK